MNDRIRKLIEAIEERGGKLHLSGRLSDEAAEFLLNEILTCPDCNAEARHRDAGISPFSFEDPPDLEWTAVRAARPNSRRRREH